MVAQEQFHGETKAEKAANKLASQQIDNGVGVLTAAGKSGPKTSTITNENFLAQTSLLCPPDYATFRLEHLIQTYENRLPVLSRRLGLSHVVLVLLTV